MSKSVAIFGSTGSIGTQALEIAGLSSGAVVPVYLSAGENVRLLAEQLRRWPTVKAVSVRSLDGAAALRSEFPNLKIYEGEDGATELASDMDCDVMLNALVGISGLRPTFAALENKAFARRAGEIALANKETLVSAGRLVMEKAREASVPIIPVDSEHSAIFQCITGNDREDLRKIWLTASGGPFLGKRRAELAHIKAEDALKHPNWDMGAKVTIDSSTLMNKGFEVIEARWLFGVGPKEIEVVVHPESIVHSMVEYRDGAVIAQLGVPEMKVPIGYAFTYPARGNTGVSAPDFIALKSLQFEKPDLETFKCLSLAFEALERMERLGTDSDTAFLNGAAEVLVGEFIKGNIGFLDIGDILEAVMREHESVKCESLEDILKVDRAAREIVLRFTEKGIM
ncbi:MAG: 1-deoxy-D-xylulose-5-phosphate reductoisomerase [Clostridiales Family XIII bacterium]|jgi:1-deoxy-D-xylulose-5-phosphate reductoisomerase|nr:1-deoxy-D-xylulose-5-phosphate reductoisomerase [Clostridiales Family XIII bacterium]